MANSMKKNHYVIIYFKIKISIRLVTESFSITIIVCVEESAVTNWSCCCCARLINSKAGCIIKMHLRFSLPHLFTCFMLEKDCWAKNFTDG